MPYVLLGESRQLFHQVAGRWQETGSQAMTPEAAAKGSALHAACAKGRKNPKKEKPNSREVGAAPA